MNYYWIFIWEKGFFQNVSGEKNKPKDSLVKQMLGASSIKGEREKYSAQHHHQAFVEDERVRMALPSNSAGVEHLLPTSHTPFHVERHLLV